MREKIIVLSGHIDDGIFGCGALLSKWAKDEKKSITYLVVSPESEPYKKRVLLRELGRALRILGLNESNLISWDFETRIFHQDRTRLLDNLFELIKDNYKYIFTPTRFDIHQDHEILTRELLRVTKREPVTVYGYEILNNHYGFTPSVFHEVNEVDINAKIKAIKKFESQRIRPSFNPDLYFKVAQVRGAQIGSDYAEAFEVIRVMI